MSSDPHRAAVHVRDAPEGRCKAVTIRVYLVVTGRGDCRLTKRRPTLDFDEVAFPVTVHIPPGWARVYDNASVEVTLPPPPEIGAPTIGQPEMDEPGGEEPA